MCSVTCSPLRLKSAWWRKGHHQMFIMHHPKSTVSGFSYITQDNSSLLDALFRRFTKLKKKLLFRLRQVSNRSRLQIIISRMIPIIRDTLLTSDSFRVNVDWILKNSQHFGARAQVVVSLSCGFYARVVIWGKSSWRCSSGLIG